MAAQTDEIKTDNYNQLYVIGRNRKCGTLTSFPERETAFEELHTQVSIKVVFIWQQFPSSDSRGWYFEEQAGEGQDRI